MAVLSRAGIHPLHPPPLGAAVTAVCIGMAAEGAWSICHSLCVLKTEQQDPQAGQGWEPELGNETALPGTGQRPCRCSRVHLALLGEWKCLKWINTTENFGL